MLNFTTEYDIIKMKNFIIQVEAKMTDYTVFDFDTTGLGVSKLEIIDIGALRVRSDQVFDSF